jgi:tetratricopeptide (TPR) repeat protein
MLRWRTGVLVGAALLVASASLVERVGAQRPAAITVDYPAEGAIFPPDISAPTFLWRDANASATEWDIDVEFADRSARIKVQSAGPLMHVGEIDPRAVGETNELPELTPQQAVSHTWQPDASIWASIKRHSVAGATVTFTGLANKRPVSHGRAVIRTSKDPVGAPIFYRDVPLMPSETEKGVIKPLSTDAVPLIAWRLRNIADTQSQVVLTGMHTCANCHSFSLDGKTLGMDLDGPKNDKGLYALAAVRPQMSIRTQDMISWKPPYEKETAKDRVGFMSQVSPDGKYVLTRLNGPGATLSSTYYVVNFKDYRFLQVFYPTRGILAWYDRATGQAHALPGADDPRFAQTDGVWSPDSRHIVFARAEARDTYAPGMPLARCANDPNETRIQYDLYRIPFNDGRGGTPEPIAGASRNGMSNNFPKISPDGRWIVFVKCRNGQLMRPDSQLYIVPVEGGVARRMRCNASPMNSWHSFSPNGRWLVFSSKRRSPYTQMYLTHIDEDGNDSPAILIENATAANRAVNIPEFVNIPPNGLMKIDVPAVDFYRQFEIAFALSEKRAYTAAIPEWEKALRLDADGTGEIDALAHMSLAIALAETGHPDAAIVHFQRAAEISPGDPAVSGGLALSLTQAGRTSEAIPWFQKALELNPKDAVVEANLAAALASTGRLDEAITHLRRAVDLMPEEPGYQSDLGAALAGKGRVDEAIPHLEKALQLAPDSAEAHYRMGAVDSMRGRVGDAVTEWRKAITIQPDSVPALNRLARVLATSSQASLRNGAEAVELAERAVNLAGDRQPALLDTLAAAYAETGQFPEAAETARRALEMAIGQDDQRLVEGLRARIELYEARTPFRIN